MHREGIRQTRGLEVDVQTTVELWHRLAVNEPAATNAGF
jgi:hypothetical protein